MNAENLIKEDRVNMRLGLPVSLDQAIKEYQDAEKKRIGKKSSKEDLLILMATIGIDQFKSDGVKMKKEFEAYQKN